jgi:hypothetical protein
MGLTAALFPKLPKWIIPFRRIPGGARGGFGTPVVFSRVFADLTNGWNRVSFKS